MAIKKTRSMATQSIKDAQDFMYGLDKFKFNSKALGYIEEDSFDWGGSAGEVTEIRAAQVKGSPVKVLPKSNGSIKPTLDLIQLSFENLAALMGGSVKKTGETVTGWEAPSQAITVTGEVQIDTDSGHRITIPNCMVQAYISGNLSMTSVSKIKCTLNVMTPADGSAPYTIEEITQEVVEEPTV